MIVLYTEVLRYRRTAEDEDEAGDEDRELIQLSLRVLVVIPRPEDVDGDVEGAKNACVEVEKDRYQCIKYTNA